MDFETLVLSKQYTDQKIAEAQLSGGNIDEAVAKYLDENPIEGGMTNTEKNLILTLFRNAAYTSNDMGAVLAQLESMWSGGNVEPDNPDNPDVPVDPDEPEKTLTSISAVYSGGDVTADTAVNDLTGIVVTAHYSDGTSEAVTGYTLSGTIVEGSNTITVSYGGKTTTFAVTGVVEAVKLRGFQLTAPSNTTEWEYPGYNSALAKAMGDANWITNVYKKKLIPAGVYYVRFLKAGASVGVNYRMHTTTDVDFFTNLTANSATELTAESVVSTFTVDGTTSFVFANSDGSYEMRTDGYQYSTAVDNGYIVLAKFVIPEGQYGILHTAGVGTNTNGTRYHEGYATVFYDDPTENITITEVVE